MKLREFINNHTIGHEDFIYPGNFHTLCDGHSFPPMGKYVLHLCTTKLSPVDFSKSSVIYANIAERKTGHEKLVESINKHPNNKYIIIMSSFGCDRTITKEIVNDFPKNVIRIYSKNVMVNDSRVIPIPIGNDIKNRPVYHKYNHLDSKKNSKLLYMNFGVDNHKTFRNEVYERFKLKKWVTDAGIFPPLQPNRDKLTYIKDVYAHKFNLSPEGRGIDCFRTWDSMYLKSIPIVQNSSFMHNFKDLPILFTDDYSEITQEYLNKKYNEMLDTDYNFDKLRFSYWRDIIQKDINTLYK